MVQTDTSYHTRSSDKVAIDAGLRAYMLKVYNYMAAGLVLTGCVAWFAYTSAVIPSSTGGVGGLTAFGQAIYTSPLQWLIMLAPLAFVMVLSFGINRLRVSTAQLLFWLFAGVMGLSLSSIFLVYTGTSITRVFFIASATFAGMSLYGYTTKTDLTRLGSFLFMGLIGIVIAMVVNIFLASSALMFAISVLGVLIFTGLTAYDTQRIRNSYYQIGGNADLLAKGALYGALSLYLDFINLFVMLLNLFGERR